MQAMMIPYCQEQPNHGAAWMRIECLKGCLVEAVKRLMKEAAELREATEMYAAQPMEDNLFEWHFTVRGPPDTDFDGGLYHGRICLPPEYPMKPPTIILLTVPLPSFLPSPCPLPRPRCCSSRTGASRQTRRSA